MSELSRKDIIQTVGQWVSALALAIGVVAAGVGYFFWLVAKVEAQQEQVDAQQRSLTELHIVMDRLIAEQEERGKKIDLIFKWIEERQAEESR